MLFTSLTCSFSASLLDFFVVLLKLSRFVQVSLLFHVSVVFSAQVGTVSNVWFLGQARQRLFTISRFFVTFLAPSTL